MAKRNSAGSLGRRRSRSSSGKSFSAKPAAKSFKKSRSSNAPSSPPNSKDERKSPLGKRNSKEKSFNRAASNSLRKTFSKEPDKSSGSERGTVSKIFFKEEKNSRDNKSFSRPPKFDETSSERQKSDFPHSRKKRNFSSKRSMTRDLDEKIISDPDKIRLNRYIANSGLCSRREADEFISMGLVTVNGKVVTELGYKVNRTDEVRYEDKVLRAEKSVYILMNKPKGYITTTKDPKERSTVMHILGNTVKERVYPVGRLDRNTTGLLLLTNDGDLADKLMHPSYKIKKVYKVELDRPITKADFKKIREGVHLEEGKAIVDDLAIISDDGKSLGIELHIGWNRVVRRIFESLQYVVVKLDRSLYAGLDKKDLPRGHWRFLTKEEVILLKHYK